MNKATTRRPRAASKSPSKPNAPLKTIKRTKISIGKKQRETRAASMAENKALRASIASEQQSATSPTQETTVLPPIKLEQKKQQLIALLDIPLNQHQKVDKILDQLADLEDVQWSPAEVGQILSLAARGPAKNYKAGAKIFQQNIKNDFLPYKSAIRGLTRLFEHGHHFSAAIEASKVFQKLYPATQYDELGMPKEKSVDADLPDFIALANQPEGPDGFDPGSVSNIEAFKTALSDARQNMFIRFDTQHHYIRQLLRQKNVSKATEQLFVLFERIGIVKNATVPGKFDPIPFQTMYNKQPIAVNFKPDFPLYYAAVDALIAQKEWSTAMTSLIYIRNFNKPIDVTPLRELTQNKQWRDFLDIHTHDPNTARLVINQLKRELVVRRGYRAEVEANVPGVAEAKTFSQNTRENALTYSPLIATEPEDLVILTDRSYSCKDIVQEKGGITFTTAFAVAQHFNDIGIDAKISHGGVLSSASAFFDHFTENPEATVGPVLNGKKKPVVMDLTVVVPKGSLIDYANRALSSHYPKVVENLADMPIVHPQSKGYLARQWSQFQADQARAKEQLAAQKAARRSQ